MLKLGGRALEMRTGTGEPKQYLRLCEDADLPFALRTKRAFLMRSAPAPEGFAGYVVLPGVPDTTQFPADATVVRLSADFEYLGANDIVVINAVADSVRVVFRASSPCNFFLVTEQCNSFCLMCSQPPKSVDDSWILADLRQIIPLISGDTAEIGFSGGEPFLFGEQFLDLLRLAKNLLPRTGVHVLSNGRSFADREFAAKYAAIKHFDCMVGIPIYSDDAATHDFVVQAKGAFDETIRGILHLKELGQRVEIRVVLHRQTFARLPKLAEFIARNLLFVDQVALMGLEITGFTRANLDKLWIEPIEYATQLRDAVGIFDAYRIPVSIYNHQLCTVDPILWRYCRQSISDWKNEYLGVCDTCTKRAECGGFFSSSIQFRHSTKIAPIL